MTVNIQILNDKYSLDLEDACNVTIDAADNSRVLGEAVYPNVARIGGQLQAQGKDRPQAEAFFKGREQVWKGKREAQGKDKTLPNPWSSAKAVVLGAIEQGISLLDADGNPVGKTEMQKAIKVAKEGSAPAEEKEKEEKNPADAAMQLARNIVAMYEAGKITKSTVADCYDFLRTSVA